MITIDAALSFSMLVVVAAFWNWWGKTRREPDELTKMIIGSVFSVAGGLCLVAAAAGQGAGKIGLLLPLMFHLLNSIGFSHILPVSLALFTRLAPKALGAFTVGIYYLAFFAANKIVGVIGGWYSTMDTVQFWLLHVASATVGLIAFTAFKLLVAKHLTQEPTPN
jgi:POT family proton-dependent oligopeptide transporter